MRDFYKKAFFLILGVVAVLVIAGIFYGSFGDGFLNRVNADSKIRSVNWRNADKFIGRYCAVEGRIVATYNSGKACFLNFHPDYKRHFTVVIFKSAFENFPKSPQVYYKGKRVRVKGFIKEYEGKPEIIVNTASEIEILE